MLPIILELHCDVIKLIKIYVTFNHLKKIIEKNLFKTKTENVIQRKYILFRKKEQQVKLVCTKYPQYDASQLG